MTPGLAWASLLLRVAGRDGLRNAWLWIGPLLVAQQIADIERRPWVVYVIPLFGLILGRSLNGRGVTPSGARIGESPALLVPVGTRARVIGAIVVGTVVTGTVSLTGFIAGQAGKELMDLAVRGRDTYSADPVLAVRGALTCVLALLPTIALAASVPPWHSSRWVEGIVLALIVAGAYFDAPSILQDLSTLVTVSSVLCVALVAAAPFLEQGARRHTGGSSRTVRRTTRAYQSVDLGAPPRPPAVALLQMHASMGLVVTSGVTLALIGLGAVVFFLSGDPSTLPFLLPMVATLGVALLPTLPMAAGQGGALGFSVSPAMWLPVRPRTLWWTSLAAACAQLSLALVMACLGTLALGLVVPSIPAADAVSRILTGAPLCAAAVLLLRAGLHLGRLIPTWARLGCILAGAFAGLAAPVEIGLPRSFLGEQRLTIGVAFLLATMAALGALTPRRVRGA